MASGNQVTNIYHYYYINNVIGSVVRGVADWVRGSFLNGRSNDIIIASYSKAIEHYRSRSGAGGDNITSPNLPFITIDPNLDFEPAEPEGRFNHNYPRGYSSFAADLYGPYIYKDDYVTLSPILNWYKGSFEITIWCSSVYELVDTRVYIYQYFQNTGREVKPTEITSYIIIPDNVVNYQYSNDKDNISYTLDWDTYSSNAKVAVIPSINQSKTIWPFALTPRLKLESISDGSDKYGSTGDDISDHRLNVSISWESEIPTHMGLKADNLPRLKNIDLDLTSMSLYLKDDGGNVESYPKEMTNIYGDSTAGVSSIELEFDSRSAYIITSADRDAIVAGNDLEITLGAPVTDPRYLRVYIGGTSTSENLAWKYVDSTTIKLYNEYLTESQINDIIVFVYYKDSTW